MRILWPQETACRCSWPHETACNRIAHSACALGKGQRHSRRGVFLRAGQRSAERPLLSCSQCDCKQPLLARALEWYQGSTDGRALTLASWFSSTRGTPATAASTAATSDPGKHRTDCTSEQTFFREPECCAEQEGAVRKKYGAHAAKHSRKQRCVAARRYLQLSSTQ